MWYNKFMFQWTCTSTIAVHAQYVPCEHAKQVAGGCDALLVLLDSYAEQIRKENAEESEQVLTKNQG